MLAALSGVLLAGAQPPYSCGWLAWMGLVPVLVACDGKTQRRRFLLGLVSGTAWSWLFVGVWLWPAARAALEMSPKTSFVLTLAAVQLCGGLYLAAFVCLCDSVRCRTGSFSPLVGAALWVALELVRTYLFGGYPWGLLGHTQWQRLTLIQVADVAGVYGVSFIIAAGNVFVADALLAVRQRAWRRTHAFSAVMVLSLVACVVSYGSYRLAKPALGPSIIDIQVVHTTWIEKGSESARELFRRLIQLTAATEPGNAGIVVWPENSIRFYVQRSRDAVDTIRKLLLPREQYLLAGGPHYKETSSGITYYNSAYLFDPSAHVVGRHDKALLVPLAERAIIALPSVERPFRSGDAVSPLRTNQQALGALICFEAIFPQVARQLVRQGATVLVNLTNDQWIGAGAAQQAAMGVFRAIENRVPFVRVSNVGPSLAVDPFGRIALIGSGKSGSVVVTLTLGSGTTPYNRRGDFFAFACLAASVACRLGAFVRLRTIVRS